MTRLDLLWLFLVGVGSSAWCVAAGGRLGATFDEPFYVAKGLESWRTGSNRALLRAGTMPLPVDVQTLPLFLWESARGEAFHPVSDLPKLLPVARAMNLVFWWPLLVYAGLLGRLWGGVWAGRVAVGLVGFEPNLLAHAALATTDIALTAAVLASVYHFAAGRGGTWRTRVLVPGVAAGLAVACKASAVTFVPLGWLVVAPPRSRSGFADGCVTALIAAAVLFGYCGCDWATEPSFVRWADHLPDGRAADAMRATARHLRVFPNAAEGIVQQVKHNLRGHGCYVLGEWHPRAVWYYFPVVLSGKLTDHLLLALAGLLALRPRSLLTPAAGIAVLYLLFSLTCRVQIGVRLVFPLVVFLTLAVAVGMTRTGMPEKWLQLLSSLCVLFALQIAMLQLPDGLRYTNGFWGGRERAADVFTDSNCDWGQGLPELGEWYAAHTDRDLFVWYYGADPAILLPPFRVVQVNHMPEPSVEAVRRRVGRGYLAVGASLLTGCPDRRPGTLAVVEHLKSRPPVARVGSFRVYVLE
jgi:hypothetical protein